MGRRPAARNTTALWPCAEPECPRRVTPRKGGKTYFLHCPTHRYTHTPLPNDFPEPPMRWSRRTCANCGTVFEKYTSAMSPGDGPKFCEVACRNIMGPKGGISIIPERECQNPDCPVGWFRPRSLTQDPKYCTQECFDEVRESKPYSRKRPEKNNAADLAEVRYCEGGCGKRLPPRDPTNNYRRKRCDDCRHKAPRQGLAADPDKKLQLVCANPDCPDPEFERYACQVKNNKTGRYFCTDVCRDEAGARTSQMDWFECQWEECEYPLFQGRPGTKNDFCSNEHKGLAFRKQTPRVCPYCKETFYKPACDHDVYCCRKHYDLANETPYGKREWTGDGYLRVYAPGHPEAQATGWAMEHRVVMSDHLGRKLAAGSSVHHKNKIRSDNRIENLEYWLGNHGPGARHDDVVQHLLSEILVMNPDKARELSRIYGGPLSTAFDGSA